MRGDTAVNAFPQMKLDLVEKHLLKRMGYRPARMPKTDYPVYEDGVRRVPLGWLYSPDGAHEAKKYFSHLFVVRSCTLKGGHGYAEIFPADSEMPQNKPLATAGGSQEKDLDEPMAVVFAIYRGLQADAKLIA